MIPHLSVGQQVLVVGHDNKPHKAKIVEVFGAGHARVESLDGQHSAVAVYSTEKETNTFHFAEEKEKPAEATASKQSGK
jgi:hypothetical protein